MDQSINQLANLTGIDRRTIGKRLESLPSKPGPNRAKLYSSADALPLLYGIGNSDGARLDPAQERARLDRCRSELAELDLARKRDELLDANDVQGAWLRIVGNAKARLLAIPTRIAGELSDEAEPRQCERIIKDALREALTELADDKP